MDDVTEAGKSNSGPLLESPTAAVQLGSRVSIILAQIDNLSRAAWSVHGLEGRVGVAAECIDEATRQIECAIESLLTGIGDLYRDDARTDNGDDGQPEPFEQA